MFFYDHAQIMCTLRVIPPTTTTKKLDAHLDLKMEAASSYVCR